VKKSDATRAAILAAARERFAAEGYERATIRAVAAQANIDPAMVIRYYGSKEGLFAAAADFNLRLPDLARVPRKNLGKTLVAHFFEVWETDETFLALLRAAVTHEVAAERLRAVLAEQVRPAIRAVSDDPASAGLVASQFLGLALCRYVLKLPPLVALTREELLERLGPVVQGLLVN